MRFPLVVLGVLFMANLHMLLPPQMRLNFIDLQCVKIQ